MDGSVEFSADEALVLDAFFRRWQIPASSTAAAFRDTLVIADEIERFCLINLSADIEGIAMDDLSGEGYMGRLEAARARIRQKHELDG